ncbi:hypothetical protein, partial [Rhizobium leguminosarum]|uniref:hypothetical protein n=1 Tax=Rhizobium leguminosarum TaxID=384 RepID=UPI001A8FC9EB
MILLSDFKRGSPFPPERVARPVLDSNSSMTTGAGFGSTGSGRLPGRRPGFGRERPGVGVAEGGQRRQRPIAVREGLG